MKILTEQHYKSALQRIDKLIEENFEQSEEKKNEFEILSKAIEAYEDIHFPMPYYHKDIQTVIRIRLAEKNLKQKEASEILGISQTRLSEILRGKRRMNIDLAQKLYKRLGIDPKIILEMA